MNKNKFFLGLIGIALGLFSLFAQDLTTTVDQVVYDHCGEPFRNDGYFGAPWGAHEGGLHGVPSNYDWAAGARPSYWMDLAGNNAITSWGQVYEDAAESPVTNVRIQLRNHKLYAYANGNWVLLDDASSNIQGSYWAEDFTSSSGYATGRDESSNGGGISFTMNANYNLHWWDPKWPRSSIPSGYEAFYITCDIRLIPNTNPGVDLSQAKYLAGVSADAYPITTSSGPGPWPSLSISRHKYITSEWQTITSYIAGPEPTSVSAYQTEIESRPFPPGVVTSSGPVAVTGVSVSPQSTSISVGNTVQLSETVSPSTATDKSVSWSSDNASVATVDAYGLITAVAEGTATITVTTTDGGFTANSTVTVLPAGSITYWIDDFNDLNNWTVSTGSPVITSGKLDIVQQTVIMTSSIIDISQSANTDIDVIAEGVTPAEMESADYLNVQYSIDGGVYQDIINITDGFAETTFSVASLTGSNLQFRIEAYTSFDNEHYLIDQIKVTMNNSGGETIAVTGVSVSPTSSSINTGSTVQLVETVSPSDATDKSVSWSSSNTSVATVNSNGLVTGVANGSATITVTTTDGSFTAQSTITVTTVVSQSMHVESVVGGENNVGKGNKKGTATVTIYDDQGNAVSNATVTITFTGDFNETHSGTTGSNGVVTVQTNGTVKGGVSFVACVDNVTHGSLTYNSNDNVVRCSDGTKSGTITESENSFSSAVNIYPNPVNNGQLFINLYEEADYAQVEIFDLSGKLLLSQDLFQNENRIDVNGMKGYVIIQIRSDANVYRQKAVVN